MASDRDYILSLQAVRAQASVVLDAAKEGGLNHFNFDAAKMDDAAKYVVGLIEVGVPCLFKPQESFKLTCSSATLAQTSSTRSPLMVAGSISRLAACPALVR